MHNYFTYIHNKGNDNRAVDKPIIHGEVWVGSNIEDFNLPVSDLNLPLMISENCD